MQDQGYMIDQLIAISRIKDRAYFAPQLDYELCDNNKVTISELATEYRIVRLPLLLH